ncbi:MAG: Gfo/Idh/MocA family oxidoreductase [Lentisphaeria bacterium]|nr:Gfo/Idh/MocA family oxidoreductase [Lentisphaeria bacterium]
MKRKIRMGMVGGGPGAFIGAVHRAASRLDGKIELVCGSFCTNPEANATMADELFIPVEKCYATYEEMFVKEAALPEGERMDFVAVTTPNSTHFPIAMAALEHGFHVLCEKPMTLSLDEALKLRAKVQETGLLFALMHNYSAYPMVRQMRKMIADGVLGELRKIVATYDLGWLAAPNAGKQATWRVKSSMSGAAACVGDIGTHAEQLIEFTTGMKISELSADLATFVEGRELDDDATIMLRFDTGAKGVIELSEVACGEENQFKLRVYGSEGCLEWSQQEPENLLLKTNDSAMKTLRRGWAELDDSVKGLLRLPAGHPEGFIEAFANIYTDFAAAIAAKLENRPYQSMYPDAETGVRGMNFIETVVSSSKQNGAWIPLKHL